MPDDPMNESLAALCDTCARALRKAPNPIAITDAAHLISKLDVILDSVLCETFRYLESKDHEPCPPSNPSE